MDVLVTGGTGFIGSHLVELLLARGYHVRCLITRDSDLSYVRGKGVELLQGDILDIKSLEAAVKGVEYVVHLAAVQTGAIDREQFFKVNASGTGNLLEASTQFAPDLKKFIHVSSISAVGPRSGKEPATEDSPCSPVDYYGESKLAGEEIALAYSKKLPLIIIRPPLVYGPRDRNRFGVLRYAKMAKKGFYLTRGGEKAYTSIIHVGDLAEGLIKAVESGKAEGEKYFLCNEDPASSEEISQLSAAALERRVKKIVIPSFILDSRAFLEKLYGKVKGDGSPGRRRGFKSPPQHWVCDGSRARQELGFQARTPLPDGIKETVLWYSRQGWI
jgi:nucleoside-diphosphate-sugar epimerase